MNTSGRRITLAGTVQGIGLRPWLALQARALGLAGTVRNSGDGVELDLFGPDQAIEHLLGQLSHGAPDGLNLLALRQTPLHTEHALSGFAIEQTQPTGTGTGVLPDRCSCPRCVADVFDPENRRYRYPLNSCSECGPRYAIQHGACWDRELTQWQSWPRCADCEREYQDMENRRYHAEGISCHRCGPRVELSRCDGRAFSIEQFTHFDAVDAAASLLRRGEIVAIQGAAGFHLACDAGNADAVAALRACKQRPRKPLAIMGRDIDMLGRYAAIDQTAQLLLQNPAAPIVLLPARPNDLPASLTPGLDTLGCMLPATPLQHLLFWRLKRPLVMTSANPPGEPLPITAKEVRNQALADWMLHYPMEPLQAADDTVLAPDAGGPALILRYGRGLAPADISLPPGFENAPAILAGGGPWKSAQALLSETAVTPSPQVANPNSVKGRERIRQNAQALLRLKNTRPDCLVLDAHPDPAVADSLQPLLDKDCQQITVHHHHAHAASCLLDNGIPADTPLRLCIVLDGLGVGMDGALWGGEFLLANYRQCRRIGRLRPAPLPGGDAAARQPWRNLWARLRQTRDDCPTLDSRVPDAATHALNKALQAGINCPGASSTGRLFDAVSCALNLSPEVMDYEAEAALLLQQAARSADREHALDFALNMTEALPEIDPAPLWAQIETALADGCAPSHLALGFHQGLARALSAMAVALYPRHDDWSHREVVLSGGVFQNALLLDATRKQLTAAGFTVLQHHRIPANDGGLATGQAVVAAATLGALH